jgi:guanine deaminase
VYDKAGLLTERSVLGHGVWLNDQDLATLKSRDCVIAHCPTANRFLQAGEMDRKKTLDAGVRISLGSDVAGGPDRSMVRVATGMIETAKQLEHVPPTAAECWWQITAGNAAAIGLIQTGRLEAGTWADIVVIKPSPTWVASIDPLSTVLYGWDDRWVEATFVAGRPQYRA